MTVDAIWWAQLPALVSAASVLYLPGLVAALIVRLRGYTAFAAAVPLSAAMLTAASLLNVIVPFRWGLVAWVLSALVLAGIAAAVRWGSSRRDAGVATLAGSPSAWRAGIPFVVIAGVFCVGAMRLASAIGRPADISQTFDNIYHLNAARMVLDGGLIAPTRQLLPGFYPDLWHIVVATTSELSGASTPIAVNAVSVILGALVWPTACVWLVRTIVGDRVDATVAAGALSIGMAAFPLLMLDFGVLYPNVLSIALLPSAVAVLVLVAGIGRGHRPEPLVRWALLIAAVPALALAHPSTLMAWLMIAFWIGLVAFPRWLRAARASEVPVARRRLATAAILGALVLGAALFLVARPSRELAYWPPSATLSGALDQLLSGALVWRPASWWVVGAAALGILVILGIRRWRAQWWVIAWLASLSILYVVCISFPQSGFRYALTGTWYQDVYRIAALFPAVLVPLGAFGVMGIAVVLRRLLGDRRWAASIPQLAGIAGGLVLLLATQTGSALATETANTQAMYRQDLSSPLINDDERTLIERLPDHVPADDVIVGNPWTGTSLSYALAERKALVPHIFQVLTPDMRTITEGLDRAGEDPRVCTALRRTHTRWVLDFGTAEIHNGDHAYPGLKNLGPAIVRLVDQQGGARLYRIISCD